MSDRPGLDVLRPGRLIVANPQPRAPEGNPERPVRAAVEAEARMPVAFPHLSHVADPGGGDEQPHPGVAHPERGELAELLGEIKTEAGTANHRVDPLGPAQVLRLKHRVRMGGERLSKGRLGVDGLGAGVDMLGLG